MPTLIGEFPRWLKYFEQHGPFNKPDQLALHRKTIELRSGHQTVSGAVGDAAFIGSLYETLRAWGIGSRRSRLRPLPQFAECLRKAQGSFTALEHGSIDSEQLDVDGTLAAIWKTIASMRIVENDAQLVAGTKTLHHLLPELVPPMDRAYTRRFFRWHVNEFQYRQGKRFETAFGAFAFVARKANPRQFVGTHPWHTSVTKVLDNALVGFMRAIDDGVDVSKTADDATISTTRKTAAKLPASAAAYRTTHFSPAWSRIVSHAGKPFRTVKGLPFTYTVAQGAVRPSRTDRNLPRSDFEKALARVPLKNTTVVQDLQGPTFVYAILMDERIRAGEW